MTSVARDTRAGSDPARSADRPATRLATRLAFLVAGFGIAAWAPLVPIVKHRLGVDDRTLGLLLLCLGIGSVAAMVATAPVSARRGARPVIVAGGLGVVAGLPALTFAATPAALGALLLLFGASMGALDAAMNVHAIEVERASGRNLMSGFHALFSIGGLAGAGAMTGLLSAGVPASVGGLLCAAPMLAAVLVAWPRLLVAPARGTGPLFALPRGVVLLLAALAAITFLVEGAMLDWSALLVAGRGLAASSHAGIGYILFAGAMTVGRLAGDRVTARLGDAATMAGGGGLAIAGLALVLGAPVVPVALGGFLLIGLGAANIVPVLFRRAGWQTRMPTALAVAAITTTGYAGVLAGPAAIGVVAGRVGLTNAFWMLAGLLCLVPVAARAVAGAGASPAGVRSAKQDAISADRVPGMGAMQIDLRPSSSPVDPAERARLLASPVFGTVFTDNMVVIPYSAGRGWHDAVLTARAPIPMDPAAAVFHYAQEIFEGMKAYRYGNGAALFRPIANAARFAASAERLAMPALPADLFVGAIDALARHDQAWIPDIPGGSLYLRPFMIANEAFLGVRPASEYLFIVIACPVGAYFRGKTEAVTVWATRDYTRAARGGTGAAKCGGNYAASLLAQAEATAHECQQVVFLDAAEGRWIEELGGMNVFFVMADGSLVTPPLGTILPGITRDSILVLAREMGITVREAPYAIDQWQADSASGAVLEAFACGTAAVVTPIGAVRSRDGTFQMHDPERAGPVTAKLRSALLDIQAGRTPDRHGWIHRIDT